MLEILQHASLETGLKVNMSKIQIMTNLVLDGKGSVDGEDASVNTLDVKFVWVKVTRYVSSHRISLSNPW